MHRFNPDESPLARGLSKVRREHVPGPPSPPLLLSTFVVWLAALLTAMVIGVAHSLLVPYHDLFGVLADRLFYGQDCRVAGIYVLLLIAICLFSSRRFQFSAPPVSWRTVLSIAAAVTIFAWAGTFLICDNFAHSMDEYLARFDAQVLASGRLAAPVLPRWREYVPALQPIFLLPIPGHAWWISNYLPVNAAFLALASKLGVESLMPPIWAGISVIATYAVGRRLWPERAAAAPTAALLLATSPQFLITAMTTFAMSPHLALNMVWLWLLLRGGKSGHAAAAAVAFLATGLHQIIFHPLFAAPFVLELWLAKRWKPALWHTCAYAMIGLFWAMYQPMVLNAVGAGPIATGAQGHGAIAGLRLLLASFDAFGVGDVSKNLVRFFTWQSLLTIPLALTAIIPAVRAGGAPRAMVLGILLTLGVMIVLMPNQGNGYGYRYLHGMLGSVCLLAGWRFATLVDTSSAIEANALTGRFLAATVLTLGVILPLRAVQAHESERPYTLAVRQIQATDADIVLVDGRGFSVDLVRNDPFLRNRPIVLDRSRLTEAQLARLCGFKVRTFQPSEAARLGVPQLRSLQRDEGELHCSQGARHQMGAAMR
jgi:hypothetical protein